SNIVVSPRGDMVYAVFGTRSSPIGGCAAQPVEVNVVAANRVWVVGAPTGRTTDPTAWKASLAVDDTAAGRIVGMQLAPGAVDTAGNVWVAYPESVKNYPDYNGAAIKLVHAAPGLAHWSRPILIAASGGAGHILPHLVAGAPGRIDLAYYTGVGTGPATIWYSDAAQVLDGLSARPLITRVQLSAVPVERGTASSLMGACLSGPAATLNGFTCGRSADVYGIALDGCGRLVVTWPAQAGFAGTDGTYVSQQTGGPTLLATRCTGGRW
ncbi:MAG TPA: hypothetical protein VNE21_06945, partial [Mycobacteriales bacterium]|nr:hypothetical protein [Mycobacteriales bacterium]